MLSVIPKRVVVYINGVRVDPISVSVTAVRSGFASFNVLVPGIPEWDILPPRSVVSVFYADDVLNKWRMLVEGEFVSISKAKTAAGQRSVALVCRSLHGIMESARNISVGSVSSVDASLSLVANGRELRPTGSTTLDMPSLDGLMSAVSSSSTVASVFFPELVRHVLSQMPAEAFYMYERKLLDKMFSLLDNEIALAVDQHKLTAFSSFWASSKAQENMRLIELLQTYEEMLMYQHLPLLAPPLYGKINDSAKALIPEILFTPYLYNVVAPACNVVFQDQLQLMSWTRDYSAEPTRVVVKMPVIAGQTLPGAYMANNVVDAYDAATELVNSVPGSNAVIASTHSVLSSDELLRGVISETVPMGFAILAANKNNPPGNPRTSWDYYFDQATRHYFATLTGRYRTAELTCVFLPMLVVGAPCLVEDLTGPFHGYIESVTHVLPNDGPPHTTITVSQVRSAYLRDGHDNTPPLPVWLNEKYKPAGIKDATWVKLLGANALDVQHGAMLPESEIVDTALASARVAPPRNAGDPNSVSSHQVNMDALAAKVIPIPRYKANFEADSVSTNTIADKLRASSDPNMAMAKYNWRPGVTLSEYAKFHGLSISSVAEVDDIANGRLPATLFDDVKPKNGVKFFASPVRMRFDGKRAIGKDGVLRQGGNVYGGYTLEAVDGVLYSPMRQNTMLTIAKALERRITKS